MKITIKKGDIIAPVTVQMLDENGQLQKPRANCTGSGCLSAKLAS